MCGRKNGKHKAGRQKEDVREDRRSCALGKESLAGWVCFYTAPRPFLSLCFLFTIAPSGPLDSSTNQFNFHCTASGQISHNIPTRLASVPLQLRCYCALYRRRKALQRRVNGFKGFK
ncbi:hypothetical protein CPC08DRAFT_46926 [Agrocybe pediades]|nr:hypothetical protein CPC08DRAFT_46926 [Agrocybe pediades]